MQYELPRITEKIPTAYDYILTIWSLSAIFGLVVVKEYPLFLSAGLTQDISHYGLTVLISFPLWAWRSFRAVLFFKQHETLSKKHIVLIVLTNIYSYLFVNFVFTQTTQWVYGKDIYDLIIFVLAALSTGAIIKKVAERPNR